MLFDWWVPVLYLPPALCVKYSINAPKERSKIFGSLLPNFYLKYIVFLACVADRRHRRKIFKSYHFFVIFSLISSPFSSASGGGGYPVLGKAGPALIKAAIKPIKNCQRARPFSFMPIDRNRISHHLILISSPVFGRSFYFLPANYAKSIRP